ncbi:hypothetical protein KFE25_004866 [Diacronema lutheri]|uniref:Uncharacterized protein n=1 Tax=Diacronema lutheri TaxID=2081491 RepID=A0A8J6CB59_DIALT|nr:hypothetical protein KFE25_004866 [Diacronema lutheri]
MADGGRSLAVSAAAMAEFGLSRPENASYRIEKVNTLASAKGVQHRCELTGLPAQVMLVSPYATLYYATREHAANAWEGIMKNVVHVVGALRNDKPAIGADERAAQLAEANATRMRLIGLCQSEASKSCVRGDFHLAIPAAVYALQLLTEVYGDGKLELVSAHLLLAEANLGARRFPQAEQFLTLANWVLVKNPQASDALRSTLRRNFGKLYASQGRFEDALRHLADDVYHSSLQFGPEHVHTSGGYFEMGACFFALERVEPALAFFDKVVDIWYKTATRLLYAPETVAQSPGVSGLAPGGVDEAMRSAGVEMLKEVRKRRVECVGERNIATGEAEYILGLLHQLQGEYARAEELIDGALEIYAEQLGHEHRSTKDVTNSLQMLKEMRMNG